MSRNRVDYLREALDSLLIQGSPYVWVSDNSSNDAVTNLLGAEYPTIPVRTRRPNVSAYEHLNLILSEIKSPYFMIFHDDDVLHVDAIGTLRGALADHPEAAGAAGNAFFLRAGRRTKERFNPSLSIDLLIQTPTQLANRYLNFAKGINPFPGYLYRREKISGLRFAEEKLGQYADLAFLNDVCERGSLYWIARPLMEYRKHENNHSGSVDLRSAKRIIQYYAQRKIFSRKAPEARLFRYWNHFFYLRAALKAGRRVRRQQLKLVTLYFLSHPGSFLLRLLQKLSFKYVLKGYNAVKAR